jgi:hypothetical protein
MMIKMLINKYGNFSSVIKPLFNINKFTFCKSKDTLLNKVIKSDLKLPTLTIQILKFLENNQTTYHRLCEESVQLSFEAANSDLLKNELMRVNKQIHEFSRENAFFEEFSECIKEILSNMTLRQEAVEINDTDIAKQAESDIEKFKLRLEALQGEIIEFLIPEESVIFINNSQERYRLNYYGG